MLNLPSSSFLKVAPSPIVRFCSLTFLAPVSFDFSSSSPSGPGGKDRLRKKGREGWGWGRRGQDSDYSLCRPLSGNRKGSRWDFKAAVLAAIPALTLLNLSRAGSHPPSTPPYLPFLLI